MRARGHGSWQRSVGQMVHAGQNRRPLSVGKKARPMGARRQKAGPTPCSLLAAGLVFWWWAVGRGVLASRVFSANGDGGEKPATAFGRQKSATNGCEVARKQGLPLARCSLLAAGLVLVVGGQRGVLATQVLCFWFSPRLCVNQGDKTKDELKGKRPQQQGLTAALHK